MKTTNNEDKDSLAWKADAAFLQAAKKVIQKAKQTDTPVVIWEEGQVEVAPFVWTGWRRS